MYAIVNRFVLVANAERLTVKHWLSETLDCVPKKIDICEIHSLHGAVSPVELGQPALGLPRCLLTFD
jgi:hypothetical protein